MEGLEEYCSKVSEVVSDAVGFVALHDLAAHLKIPVLFRPLLVEAMIASQEISGVSRLVVLADSETFNVKQEHFLQETAVAPLPERLRNTLAHELLHSLSFQLTETFQRFRLSQQKRETREYFLKRVERQTEKLSPLLLILYRVLRKLALHQGFTASDLSVIRKRCSVSRDVLVSRIVLLSISDPEKLRFNSSLQNTVIGVGEWKDAGTPQLLSWPLFANFIEGWMPPFVDTLKAGRLVLVPDIVKDPEFFLTGGDSLISRFPGHEKSERREYMIMEVSLRVEEETKKRKGRFLYVLRKES